MASNSGWDKTVPSGSSSIADGDDDIRSFKSFMQEWWEQEHYATDGSASSAGIAKHGAGRAFVGPASQLSNPTADNDGRFLFATDTATLYVGQVSSSSWTAIADAILLSSQQTWTALQEFTSGVTVSQLTVTGDINALSFATVQGDLYVGSGTSLSLYSRGHIHMEVASGAPTPSVDSSGNIFIQRGGTNYELVIRWGDGTQDVIVTGPTL